MSRERFEEQYRDDWRRLEWLLDRFDDADQRSPTAWRQVDCGDFPELYRRVCHQLALARSRLYSADLEQRLHRLVLRGHHRLYSRRGVRWAQVVEFFTSGFPRQVRREARLVLASLLLFAGPLLAMHAGVRSSPELIYSFVDADAVAQTQEMYDPATPSERDAQTDVAMFGLYVYNNVSIAFQTFAGGLLLGVGSIFYLVYNGLAIGGVAGHLTNVGYGETFYPFVVGHGSLELTAIVLAGASGLKLGLTVVAPGRRSRRRALVAAGRASMRMVWGIFAMLLLAAFVEAFWSSSSLVPDKMKILVGLSGWAAVAAYFLFAGRGDGA